MITQAIQSDITIIGGGLAGVAAAIGAARLGRSVALINNRPVLGGNSSSEVRVWVCGATSHGIQRFARESGIIGEILLENQYRNPEGNPVHWDDVVLDAVRAEPNIRLFLNTDVRRLDVEDKAGERVITAVHGWTMGSEIDTEFTSPYMIDATGDGLIGYLAGADFMLGREGRDEYGETWAPQVPDGEFLGSTILFYTKDLGRPVRFVAPNSAKDITQTPIPTSRILRSGDNGAHYWWIEWGGELDIVHDNERIRDELRSVILGIWDYIKNSGKFDAETLDLEWVGNVPGKREYRRFLGDHVLTQNDILDQVDHADAVAFGGWSIDLHPVEGMYATKAGAHQRYSDGIYGIPFRSYYSRNVDNLLLAGRDISASHVAFGSSRVMATCAAGGEAAGTGAVLALELGVRPRELAKNHPERLRQLLLRQDAAVFGIRNDDPEDLARSARITASSTADSIDPAAFDGSELDDVPVPLEVATAAYLPVDPYLDAVELLATVSVPTELTVSLWTTGKRQNVVPADRRVSATVSVYPSPEPQWIRVPLEWNPVTPEAVVVVMDPVPGVELYRRSVQVSGVLALVNQPQRDEDENVEVDESEKVVAWPAIPLRGSTLRVRTEPPTAAYAADKAVGGYQRPYGGPQMWVSAPRGFVEPEWLQLNWESPQTIETLRLVFDDDVDIELNTLHHHRTPELIFPELVRDYVIEALAPDTGWKELLTVRANRRRQRVHRLEAPITATALRLRVLSSNGVPQARVVSLRAYGPDTH